MLIPIKKMTKFYNNEFSFIFNLIKHSLEILDNKLIKFSVNLLLQITKRLENDEMLLIQLKESFKNMILLFDTFLNDSQEFCDEYILSLIHI